MTAAGLMVGLLAGATVWSLQLARAATGASRVRRRLVAGAPGPSGARTVPLPPPPALLTEALGRAGVEWPVATVWPAWLSGGFAVVVGAFLAGGPVLAVIAMAGAVAAPAAVLRAAAGRGDRLLEAGVPVVLERIARSLRAGGSLSQSLQETADDTGGALGDDLRAIVREAPAGAPLVEALDGWARRRPLPTIRLAVAALALGAETGGAQAQALDGLATTLRDRLAVAAEVRALSSQARLSALVISVAPLGFAAFAAATDPRSAQFLLRTPAGIACLCVGLTLDAVAAWWMARLTRSGP